MNWEYLIGSVGPRLGTRSLSIEEVKASGTPASFQGFGESLLYIDGRLFDLRHDALPAQQRFCPPMLEPDVLRYGVGIEYGWRHIQGCCCAFCEALEPVETAA